MKKTEKRNPLQEYLDRKLMRPLHFAKLCKVHQNTIYYLLSGKRKATRTTVNLICDATNGELKRSDFGYDS